MICRTPEEAFQAGWDSPCEHGVPDPNDCERCELTPDEIAFLVALHRPYLRPPVDGAQPAA